MFVDSVRTDTPSLIEDRETVKDSSFSRMVSLNMMRLVHTWFSLTSNTRSVGEMV